MGSLAAPPVSQPDLSNHREKESSCAANSSLLSGGRLPVGKRWLRYRQIRCGSCRQGVKDHHPVSLLWRGKSWASRELKAGLDRSLSSLG